MKKVLSSPIATVVLFALAALFIGFGGINAIQAAPRIESSDYRAQVQLTNINVAVTEKQGEDWVVVEGEDTILRDLTDLANNGNFKIGETYPKELAVRNTQHPSSTNEGEGIDEYVRVTVYCYWTDENGKAVNLDPRYIKLNWRTDNGWVIDEAASSHESDKPGERTVLYYKDVVPVGQDTKPFADTITIDKNVAMAMSGGKYAYENVKFHVKVTADAVQTHNGKQAMMSAWGRTNENKGE